LPIGLNRGYRNRLVVFLFCRKEEGIFSLQGLGNFREEFFVFFKAAAPRNNQGEADFFGHGLAKGHTLFHGLILSVGIRAFENQAHKTGTGHLAGLCRRIDHGLGAGVKSRDSRDTPVWPLVGDFHAHADRVLDFPVKTVEGEHLFAP